MLMSTSRILDKKVPTAKIVFRIKLVKTKLKEFNVIISIM